MKKRDIVVRCAYRDQSLVMSRLRDQGIPFIRRVNFIDCYAGSRASIAEWVGVDATYSSIIKFTIVIRESDHLLAQLILP